jgi:alpha-tubulin suppressor-like RCC1 family protein
MLRRVPWLAVFACVAVIGCSGTGTGPAPATPERVGSVVVEPELTQIRIAETFRLFATALDGSGNPLSPGGITWSTTNASVATVDAEGVVRGVAGGQVEILASRGGRTGRATITVLFPAIGAVDISVSPTRFLFGRSTQVRVTPRDSSGATITGCLIRYTSSDGTIAFASNDGVVTGIGVGRAEIQARVECRPGVGAPASMGAGSIEVIVDPLRFTAIAPGGGFICGLVQDGAAYCSGGREFGGNSQRTMPADLPGPVRGTQTYRSIATAPNSVCAIESGGRVYCWGLIPTGPQVVVVDPAPVAGGHLFGSLDLTMNTFPVWACGISDTGQALCWGDNHDLNQPNAGGWLGTGSRAGALQPTPVAGGLSFVQISAGALHTCGIVTDGRAFCWGMNDVGQLGTGEFGLDPWETELHAGVLAPVPVAGGRRFTQISAGWESTCGITTERVALCWGENRWGQLGDGTTMNRALPVVVGNGMLFRSIGVGDQFTCGLALDGQAFCWGSNWSGVLGDGTSDPGAVTPTPTPVPTALRFQQIETGWNRTCGIATSGLAYCWGSTFPIAGATVPTLVPGQQ